mmetsp:Transcript_30767/g.93038  ORF Transcript_30767/g.93038 Transcript_30767/m.93038 type:complete len:243 (-) Transcript_30767:1449-2177(-)
MAFFFRCSAWRSSSCRESSLRKLFSSWKTSPPSSSGAVALNAGLTCNSHVSGNWSRRRVLIVVLTVSSGATRHRSGTGAPKSKPARGSGILVPSFSFQNSANAATASAAALSLPSAWQTTVAYCDLATTAGALPWRCTTCFKLSVCLLFIRPAPLLPTLQESKARSTPPQDDHSSSVGSGKKSAPTLAARKPLASTSFSRNISVERNARTSCCQFAVASAITRSSGMLIWRSGSTTCCSLIS